MRKVIVHNFSIPYARVRSGFFNIDQSGLFFAEKGDIVVTRQKTPEVFIEYLETLGYDFQNLQFVYSQKLLPEEPEAIFVEEDIKDKVRSLINKNPQPTVLDSFMVGNIEAAWSKIVGIKCVSEPEHYFLFGNKSKFRAFMKNQNFSVPRGFSNLTGQTEGAIAAAFLLLTGAEQVVVKQDEGVAGLGSSKFSKTELLAHAHDLHKLFLNPNTVGVRPVQSKSFVVEKWYSNTICSPSIQLFINEEGKVRILSVHQQHFYSNNMTYAGCSSDDWLEEEVVTSLKKEGMAIANTYAKAGMRGHCTLNAVVLENNEIIWVELNPRRVISSYPAQIMNVISKGGTATKSYMTYSIGKEKWKGRTIAEILVELKPVLFSLKSNCGVILMHYHFLKNLGEVTVIAVGRNPEEVKFVIRAIQSL